MIALSCITLACKRIYCYNNKRRIYPWIFFQLVLSHSNWDSWVSIWRYLQMFKNCLSEYNHFLCLSRDRKISPYTPSMSSFTCEILVMYGDYRLTWRVNSLSIGPNGQHFIPLGNLSSLESIRLFDVSIFTYSDGGFMFTSLCWEAFQWTLGTCLPYCT